MTMPFAQASRRQMLLGASAALTAPLAIAMPHGSAQAADSKSASTAGTGAPGSVPWSAGTEKPTLQAPPGAVDCHHHIYDSRYPAVAGAQLTPPDASVADYRLLQARIGTSRHVIVQPSTYGTDNRATVDAMRQFNPAKVRGIAVVNDSVTEAELRAMHHAGVRGVRFNLVRPGITTQAMLEPVARKIAPLGWHIQLLMAADQLPELAPALAALPCPLVLDHMGHLPQPAGIQHPAFGAIQKLLENGKTWVKLSAPYIGTRSGPPGYEDTSTVAKALWKANPERMVWGSDWPHPTLPPDRKPDDAVLFDLIRIWVGNDAESQRRLLVENPGQLYFS